MFRKSKKICFGYYMETIKVFIASSSELNEERKDITLWLSEFSKKVKNFNFEAVRYETDLTSGSYVGKKIQPAINPFLEKSERVRI